jgi:hypothetical protein
MTGQHVRSLSGMSESDRTDIAPLIGGMSGVRSTPNWRSLKLTSHANDRSAPANPMPADFSWYPPSVVNRNLIFCGMLRDTDAQVRTRCLGLWSPTPWGTVESPGAAVLGSPWGTRARWQRMNRLGWPRKSGRMGLAGVVQAPVGWRVFKGCDFVV